MSSTSDFEHTFDKETKVYQVYLRLQDHQWHCRECEYTNTGIRVGHTGTATRHAKQTGHNNPE